MKKKSSFSASLFFLMIFITLQIFTAQTISFAQTVQKKKQPPPPANSWSAASAISPICQPDPTRGSQLNDVAVNASGTAIAAWDQFTYNGSGGASIGAAVKSAGKWGAPFTISDTNGFALSPKVAIGADGTMAVSWRYQDRIALPSPQLKIQVAIKPAGATAWTITTLAQSPLGGASLTQLVPVSVDPSGNVTACWIISNSTQFQVQAAMKPAGGAWQAPVLVAPGVNVTYVNMAVNDRGDASIVYTMSPYATATAAQYVFRSGPNGVWTTPVTISEAITWDVGYITSPMVALDANGLGTVAYMGYGVEVVRQQPGGSWTSPRTVLQAPNRVSSYLSPDLAVDGAGNAVVVVSIFDATIGVDRASVWVAIGSPAGVWTTQQRITDPTVPVDAYATRAAISPDGALVLVGWIDHYHGTVQVSKLSGGIWGAANTIGKGTAWSSSQEVLGLDAASSTVACAIWKNAKTGTQTMAVSYTASVNAAKTTISNAKADYTLSTVVMPNPNKGNFTIQLRLPDNKTSTTLQLYNSFGVKIWQTDLGEVSGTISKNVFLENKLSAGVYQLIIQRSDVHYTTKIVISK